MARRLLKKPLKRKTKKPKVPAMSFNDAAYGAEEEATTPEVEASQLKTKIAAQAVSEFEAGLKYKQKRMDIWLEIEKTYNLEKEKTLQVGRFDYPLPILSGYVDTLHSKIDDEPYLEYDHLTLADKPRAQRTTAAWRFYSNPEHADWAGEDRAGKKVAIMTGRAIFLTYCESDPEFAHYFELIDSYDYVAQPLGGGDIKKHTCGYQDNIFRSKWELKEGAQYDQTQVAKLIANTSDKDCKRNALLHRNKINRLISVGLNPEQYSDYAGSGMYRLTQGFTTYEGTKYWVVMDMSTGTWIRIEKLNEVFSAKRPPFVSFATHYDKFNFWTKCPAEDILPVARGMRDLYNEGMYNIRKRNSGQRAYDPEVFDEPELLEWRPDGLVPGNSMPGKPMQNGIYEFRTEDNTAITVNLMEFSDALLGKNTGITAGAKGASDKDTKVGVYYGDLQQVADRLGLTNKYYASMWRDAGDLFAWGIWEHFPNKLMIRVTGESDWIELTKADVDPDFAVIAKSTKAELEANEFKKKQKNESLGAVMQDPRYASFVNPILAVEHRLRNGGWEEDDIRALMDLQVVGDEKSIVKAAQAIQDLLEGKVPRVYRKAGLAFLHKIKDYMDENEMDLKVEQKFLGYFAAMSKIVAENVARMGMMGPPRTMLPQAMMPNSPLTPPGMPPAPGTPAGTASRGQDISQNMSPEYATPQ